MRSSGRTQKQAKPGAARRVAVVAVAALLALAFSSPAGAVPANLALSTGPTFLLGSGAALGTAPGLYLAGTQFPGTSTPLGGTLSSIQLTGLHIPDITLGAFDAELFTFQPLSGGVPTDTFTLTYDSSTGQINPGLSDPQVLVEMRRFIDGSPSGVDTFLLDLTTGSVSMPLCGGAAPRTISGSPVSGGGAVTLIGGLCLATYGGSPFDTPFEIKMEGTLTLGAIPEPGTAPLLALGMLGLAVFPGFRRSR